MNFGNLQWLFPIVVTLHNAEEAIWFPDWTKRAGRWHAPCLMLRRSDMQLVANTIPPDCTYVGVC